MPENLIKLGDTDGLPHVPLSPEQTLGNSFQSACKCGYPGAAKGTPSHAYNATSVHADMANYREGATEVMPGRPAPWRPESARLRQTAAVAAPSRPSVGSPATSGGAPGTARPPRAPRASGGAPRPCGCGCTEMTGGGIYRPGHDARHAGNLQKRVIAKELTATEAVALLDGQPKLQAKLAGRLGVTV